MCKYDDKTMEPIPLTLAPSEKEHRLVLQDECLVNTNDSPRCQWLKVDQQPLKKKENGCGIHISNWICEHSGQLALNKEQIATQAALPEEQCLKVTVARKIIYPGKNHDAWWNLDQLMEQTKHAVNIFEYLHPEKVAIWVFDCSSPHEGLAIDALNVNNMNVNPGGKQRHLCTTVIPMNNPPSKPGCIDTQGQMQTMVYPEDHTDPKLQGKLKGIKAVLQEQESVWDELMTRCRAKAPVGKCGDCSKSQAKKDAEQQVVEAEAMGQEDALADADITQADELITAPSNDWCCMHCVLSLQDKCE